MKTTFTYWKEDDYFIGHLDEYPEYDTQGVTLVELQENLLDLYKDLSTDAIPGVRHRAELEIA